MNVYAYMCVCVYVCIYLYMHTRVGVHMHSWRRILCINTVQSLYYMREIMLFIGKPRGRSIMISNATNPLKESRKESLLRCAGSTSICVWLVCDLVVMCVQAVGDRALGDLCVCVGCGSVQSQKV